MTDHRMIPYYSLRKFFLTIDSVQMIWKSVGKHADLGLLILRLGFGLAFLYFHGWGKITGGPEQWAQIGGAMEALWIPFGHVVFGFLAALAESLGAVLIMTGLFFRPASLMLCFVMVMASMAHITQGFGTPAHAIKNVFVMIGLFYVGPGKYSLDAKLFS